MNNQFKGFERLKENRVLIKVIKIVIISIISVFVLHTANFLINVYFYSYKDTEQPKITFKDFFKKELTNKIFLLKQIEYKHDLMSSLNYYDKYQLIIWEYNSNKVADKLLYHVANFEKLDYVQAYGATYGGIYTGENPSFQINFSNRMNFGSSIYIKFYKDDEIVISSTTAKKFYSINYFSDHITIGSSLNKSEVLMETQHIATTDPANVETSVEISYPVKTNLVILNRKGKLVFIFAYAKDGVEPIKDYFLLDILKPSLLTEGLH
jgi:hypothetical protein